MDQTNHESMKQIKESFQISSRVPFQNWTYIELASLLKSSQLFFFPGKFAKTPEFHNLLSKRGYHDTRIITED